MKSMQKREKIFIFLFVCHLHLVPLNLHKDIYARNLSHHKVEYRIWTNSFKRYFKDSE